jgi:hypothetical protein
MKVKEVRIADAGDRFVICYNPDQATRDQAIRDDLVAQLSQKIAGTDSLDATKRAELRGRIVTKPGLNRYLRLTDAGLLRIDRAAVKAEQRLDGKSESTQSGLIDLVLWQCPAAPPAAWASSGARTATSPPCASARPWSW